ncbi:hypothetical protein DSO57_1006250 [Entomophthora muscae]|uniref:Uncharacterized protein n=1 Tax=Entomophthora muscae TaxID=34485 RepID=A0ACC2TVD0_9FUNG|nr:hypothetical protein DSO57_1006250 [Entomophthora muscae]
MAGIAEDKILVLEFGTYSIKLKVGTDDVGSLPNLEIRSQIGIPSDLLTSVEEEDAPRSKRISDENLKSAFTEGKLVLGSELTKYFSADKPSAEKGPIKVFDTLNEDGIIDWSCLKLLLIHLLACELEIALDDNDSALLVAVPLSWPKVDLEHLSQLCFENLNSPALFILPQPLATLYGYGVSNGLVVDIGYSSTKLTPIIDCCVIGYGHSTLAFGTKDFDELLLEYILGNTELQSTFSEVKLDLDLVQYLREAGYLSFIKKEGVLNDGSSRVSPSKSNFDLAQNTVKIEYNGTTIQVKEALLEVSECVFATSLKNMPSLAQQLIDGIFQAIERCDPEKRSLLWDNIALSGGFSCAKGLGKSLEQALQARMPITENSGLSQSTPIKVTPMPEYFSKWKGNPHLATMLGSTITAKYVFQDPKLHITKLDYSESGPLIIHNKSA